MGQRNSGNAIYGGDGDDIIIANQAKICGGSGADQFWCDPASAWLEILDADAADSLMWYGHRLTGGKAKFLDLEINWGYKRGSNDWAISMLSGWVDENNVIYQLMGRDLRIILPSLGSITIRDYDYGDAGIFLDKDEMSRAWVSLGFDEEGSISDWKAGLPLWEFALDGEINNFDITLRTMPAYGPLETPTTFIQGASTASAYMSLALPEIVAGDSLAVLDADLFSRSEEPISLAAADASASFRNAGLTPGDNVVSRQVDGLDSTRIRRAVAVLGDGHVQRTSPAAVNIDRRLASMIQDMASFGDQPALESQRSWNREVSRPLEYYA